MTNILPRNTGTLQTIVSADGGNIIIAGSDGGAFLDAQGSTGYQLPAPQWELININTNLPTIDSVQSGGMSQLYGNERGVRLPLVSQELIDNGELFVEYGRIKESYIRIKQNPDDEFNPFKWERNTKIRWYSSWDGSNSITGRGYSTGHHEVGTPRLNMFPVNVQSMLAPAVPRNLFYKNKTARYYNGDHSSPQPWFFEGILAVCGSRVKKISRNMLNNASNFGKRLKANQLKDVHQHSSERYARLVVIRDGRIIQQGPHSDPLFIELKGLPHWNERDRVYEKSTRFIDGAGSSKRIEAVGTIGHKLKQ